MGKKRKGSLTKRRKKKNKFKKVINKWIPYFIVGAFAFVLYRTQFFQITYVQQRDTGDQFDVSDKRTLTVLDISTPSDVMEMMINFQEYFSDIMTDIQHEQLYSFLNDALAFMGDPKELYEKIPQIQETLGFNFKKPKDQLVTEDSQNVSSDSQPLIYLMNTHTAETFESDQVNASFGRVLTIQDFSNMMATNFESLGINAIVESRDIGDFLLDNDWKYHRSYEASRIFLEEMANQYDSLKFFFDFHRDSLEHQWTTIDINGESFAKIIMIIGADHEGHYQNYAMAQHIHQQLEERYPGLSKGVTKKSGAGVDGVYNQDFAPTLLLFEIGGIDNTYEEIQNTARVLSEILADYIQTHENY